MLENAFESIGLGAEESRVYLALLESGPSSAGALARRMGTPRPSMYGFLKRLVDTGAVGQSIDEGVKIFTAEEPQIITRLFRERIENLEAQNEMFSRLIPALEQKKPGAFLKPRLEFFEGREGVRNVLKDMLLYSGIETRSYWPMKDMVDIVGGDFFERHNKTRIRNKVHVKAIWPHKQAVSIRDHPYLGGGKGFYREIRIAPEHVNFSMGYWIYKNKTAFLSSVRECFGFIIESAEMSEMMTSQHELAWQVSKKLTVREKDVASFLRRIKKENI